MRDIVFLIRDIAAGELVVLPAVVNRQPGIGEVNTGKAAVHAQDCAVDRRIDGTELGGYFRIAHHFFQGDVVGHERAQHRQAPASPMPARFNRAGFINFSRKD